MAQNYSNLNNPYDNHLSRENVDAIAVGTTSLEGGESTVSGSDSSGGKNEGSVTGNDLSNLWIGSWIKSRNYKPRVSGFYLNGRSGDAEFANVTLSGGTIMYGKTSFSDSVNAGYVLCADGIYFGAANDANYLKYTLSSGVFTLYGVNVDNPTLTNLKSGSEIAIQGWQFDATFSSSDYRTVAWTGGTIKLLDGTTFTITAGTTGNMAAVTYIYFAKGTSEIALQITTTAANAVGTGKILIAVANLNSDTTSRATFQVFGGKGGELLAVDNIAANSASTNEFISNTAQIKDAIITSAKIDSLVANKITSGTISSKTITLAVTPDGGNVYINAGKTAFDNLESGFILGVDDSDEDKAKFYIGDNYNYLNWTGEKLLISGYEIYDAIVDPAGNGNYVEIQAAIEDGKKNLFLKRGRHILKEAVEINEATNITGENRYNTIISRTTNHQFAGTNESGGFYYLGSENTNFDITNTTGNTFRYTWLGGGDDPRINLMRRGDRISIGSSSNFNVNNSDTFILTAVGADYFEVTNASGVVESNVTVGADSGQSCLMLYRNSIGNPNVDQYSVTNPDGTTFRYTIVAGGSNPYLDERFSINDFLYISDENTAFNVANRGFFKITGIAETYIEISNASGVVEANNTVDSYDFIIYGFLGDSTTQFDITESTGHYIRYTWDGTGTDPEINKKLVIALEIQIQAQNFNAYNNGNFIISRIGTNWFEVYNANGVAESNKTIGTGYIRRYSDILGDSSTTIAVTNPSGTTWRYTYSSGLNPYFEHSITIDDEIFIDAGSGFTANNEGNALVTAVGTGYFEVSKAAGTEETVTVGTGLMVNCKSTPIKNLSGTSSGGMKINTLTIKDISNNYGALYNATAIIDCSFSELSREYGYLTKYPNHIERCSFSLNSSSAYLYGIFLFSDVNVKIINNYFDTVWGSNMIYCSWGSSLGDSTTQFDVTNTAGTTYRYTYDGTGTDPGITAAWDDYYVNISNTDMSNFNEGIFLITAAGTNYFEVTNAVGVAENNKTIGASGFIKRIYNNSIPDNIVIANNKFYSGSAATGETNLLDILCTNSVITGNNFDASYVGESDNTLISISGMGNSISNNSFYACGNHIKLNDFGKTVITSNYFNNYGSAGVYYSAVANNENEGYTIISNNVFDGVTQGNSIEIVTATSGVYHRLNISGNTCRGGVGFLSGSELTSCIVSNNICSNTSDVAFDLNGCQYTVITNNVTDTCVKGFDINNLDYCTILGNISRNNTNADTQSTITNSENAHNIFKT